MNGAKFMNGAEPSMSDARLTVPAAEVAALAAWRSRNLTTMGTQH